MAKAEDFLFKRENSRHERSQPLGQIGFSIASFGFLAGGGYSAYRFYPQIREKHFPQGIHKFVQTRLPWEQAASVHSKITSGLSRVFGRSRTAGLGMDSKTPSWSVPINYRARLTANPRAMFQFEENLATAHRQMQAASVAEIRDMLKKITSMEVKDRMVQGLNQFFSTGGSAPFEVNLANTPNLSERLGEVMSMDESGLVKSGVRRHLILANRLQESINEKVSFLANQRISQLIPSISPDKAVFTKNLYAQQMLNRELPGLMKLYFPLEGEGLPASDVPALFTQHLTSKSIPISRGVDSSRSVAAFFDQYVASGINYKDIDYQDVVKWKNPTLGMRSTFYAPFNERRMFLDLIGDIQRHDSPTMIQLIPDSPHANTTTMTMSISGPGDKPIKVTLPFTNQKGLVNVGGQLRMVSGKMDRQGRMTQVGPMQFMAALRRDLPQIESILQEGNATRAQKRLDRLVQTHLQEPLSAWEGRLGDLMQPSSFSSEEARVALGIRDHRNPKKDVARYMTQMTRLFKTKAAEDMIFLDIESTGLDKRKSRIWNVGAIHVKNGREVSNINLFMDPGDIWKDYKDVPKEFRSGEAGFHITKDYFEKTIKGAGRTEKEGLASFLQWIQDPSRKGAQIAGHNAKDFDIPLFVNSLERRGLQDEASAIRMKANFDGRMIDTLLLSRILIERKETRAWDLQSAVRAVSDRAYVETHLSLSDSRGSYKLLQELQTRIKDMTYDQQLKAVHRFFDGGDYVNIAGKEGNIKALMNAKADAQQLHAYNMTMLSSDRAGRGFFSTHGAGEMEPFGGVIYGKLGPIQEAPHDVRKITGKELSGYPTKGSKALHPAYKGLSLSPRSAKRLKNLGQLGPMVTSDLMVKSMTQAQEQTRSILGHGYAKGGRETLGHVMARARVVWQDSVLAGMDDVVVVDEEFAKNIKTWEPTRNVTIPLAEMPKKADGTIDVDGFDKRFRGLIKQLNAMPEGDHFAASDNIENLLKVPTGTNILKTQIGPEYGYTGKYDGRLLSMSVNRSGARPSVTFNFAMEVPFGVGSRIGGLVKATIITAPKGSLPGGAQMMIPKKLGKVSESVFQSSVLSGSLSRLERRIEGAIQRGDAKALEDLKANHESIKKILRDEGNVLLTDYAQLKKAGLLTDKTLENLGSERTLMFGTTTMMEEIKLMQSKLEGQTKALEEGFSKMAAKRMLSQGDIGDAALMEAHSKHQTGVTWGSMKKIAELAGFTYAEVIAGQDVFYGDLAFSVVHKPNIAELYSALPIGMSAHAKIERGIKFDRNAMSNLDTLQSVNKQLADMFGQSSSHLRKNLSSFADTFKAYAEANAQRVGYDSGLFKSMINAQFALEPHKYLKADEVPNFKYTQGKGWTRVGQPNILMTSEQVMETISKEPFMVHIPKYAEGDFGYWAYDDVTKKKEWINLGKTQVGHRLVMPGLSEDDILRKPFAQGSEIFHPRRHLARAYRGVLQAIERGGESPKRLIAAFEEMAAVTRSTVFKKGGIMSEMTSAHFSGAIRAQVENIEAMVAQDIKNELGTGLPVDRMELELHKRLSRIKPGTLVMDEAAAIEFFGDARYDEHKRRMSAKKVRKAKWAGNPWIPKHATAFIQTSAIVGRYPMSSVALADVIVVPDIMGKTGADAPLLLDRIAQLRAGGDFDGDQIFAINREQMEIGGTSEQIRMLRNEAARSQRAMRQWGGTFSERYMEAAMDQAPMLARVQGQEMKRWSGAVLLGDPDGGKWAVRQLEKDGKMVHEFYKAQFYTANSQNNQLIPQHERLVGKEGFWMAQEQNMSTLAELERMTKEGKTFKPEGKAYIELPHEGSVIRALDGGATLDMQQASMQSAQHLTNIEMSANVQKAMMHEATLGKILAKIGTGEKFNQTQNMLKTMRAMLIGNQTADATKGMMDIMVESMISGKHVVPLIQAGIEEEIMDTMRTLTIPTISGTVADDAVEEAMEKLRSGKWAAFDRAADPEWMQQQGYGKLARISGAGPAERARFTIGEEVMALRQAALADPKIFDPGQEKLEKMISRVVPEKEYYDVVRAGSDKTAVEAHRIALYEEAVSREAIQYRIAMEKYSINVGGKEIPLMEAMRGRVDTPIEPPSPGLSSKAFRERLGESISRDAHITSEGFAEHSPGRGLMKGGVGKAMGYAGLAFLAINFFRPNQMGNLGDLPGRGGEVYDTGFSSDEIPRGVPLSIPQYTWQSKVRFQTSNPYMEEKNARLMASVYDTLGVPVRSPSASRTPSVNVNKYLTRSSIPQLNTLLQNVVVGNV